MIGADALGASERPLTDVLETAVGSTAGRLVAVVAMVSTTNTALLALTAGSRMAFGMARDDALPRGLSRVAGRGSAPIFGIAACGLAAAAFALIGDLKQVAATTDAAIYFVFLATNVTLIILRIRQPELHRPFRVPFAIGKVPLVPILALAATLLLMSLLDADSLLSMAALGALGLLVFATMAIVRKGLADVRWLTRERSHLPPRIAFIRSGAALHPGRCGPPRTVSSRTRLACARTLGVEIVTSIPKCRATAMPG